MYSHFLMLIYHSIIYLLTYRRLFQASFHQSRSSQTPLLWPPLSISSSCFYQPPSTVRGRTTFSLSPKHFRTPLRRNPIQTSQYKGVKNLLDSCWDRVAPKNRTEHCGLPRRGGISKFPFFSLLFDVMKRRVRALSFIITSSIIFIIL